MNVREKGMRGEYEIRDYLNKKFGVKFERTPLSGGMDIKGDIRKTNKSRKSILDGLHWEVKRVEKINIHQCFRQSVKDCEHGKIPLVVFRRNNEKWHVCLTLDDFTDILKIMEDDKGIKKIIDVKKACNPTQTTVELYNKRAENKAKRLARKALKEKYTR